MMRAAIGRRQAGFSLLEVLVAFAILALSLGVLLQIFSRSVVTTSVSSVYNRAVAVAEARLAQVGTAIPLEEGVHTGEAEDGFEWEVQIVPYEFDNWLGEDIDLRAFRVTAVAVWRDGESARSLAISTLRIASESDIGVLGQ